MNAEMLEMVPQIAALAKITVRDIFLLSHWYYKKDLNKVQLESALTQFTNHGDMPQPLIDFCIDYLSHRVRIETDRNPKNGNKILRVVAAI